MSQGFPAFCLALPRIPPRHSQTTRATNCANPGFLVIEFCARCGQTCGQAVFLTTSACGGSACIAGVSRDCGHGIFRLEGGSDPLPNQARYQLRYTRILNDLMGMDPPEATRRRALHTIPVHYNTPAAKREANSYPFFFGRGLICTWTGWIN